MVDGRGLYPYFCPPRNMKLGPTDFSWHFLSYDKKNSLNRILKDFGGSVNKLSKETHVHYVLNLEYART